MKRFLISIMLISSCSLPLYAAGGRGELLIGGNGGASLFSLGNKTTIGSSKLGLSYGGGLEYNANLFSNKKFGLGLVFGVKYSSLSSTVTFDDFSQDKASTIEVDKFNGNNEYAIDFYANIKGYKSTSTLSYLQVPVYFRETFTLSSNCEWFLEEGVNLGYGLGGTTKNTINELRTSIYSQDLNATYDDIAFMGSGTRGVSFSGENKLNFSADAHLETGVKVFFGGFWVIYIGVYADYSILQSYKGSSADFGGDFGGDLVQYQPQYEKGKPVEFKYASSLYTSKYGDSKIHPLSFGLSLRLGLNFDRMALRGGVRMFDEEQ